ncbi:AraC-type DNA-binding protein [Tenacibaculum sp. MAR_2009_124]|uniref:helix-turn-helix domain-containing protein n=1 Tax=Tenacibaculum sp. MAR_2009_124 TaxID=1250059 RepID=UPI000896C49D|nr:AraC family transcriptional regulator [Tenacibaculum sp. MAR_2009_124]SED06744.1 AraC-type DNA-binding protein [Tenacibaculum sp. MAR_2009_124]
MINDIAKITVFLLLLLALFIITVPSKNKASNYFFAAFLIVTSFDFTAIFLENVFINFPALNATRVATVFLQMPLFYLYVKKTCYKDLKISFKELLHGIPFLIFLGLFLTVGLSGHTDLIYEASTQTQYYSYIIAILYTLKQYRNTYLENYTSGNETYKWLKTTTLLFLIGNSLVLLRAVLDKEKLLILNTIIFSFALTIICWFVLKTMRTPHLFTGIHKDIKPLPQKETIEESEKYDDDIAILKRFMKENKPYLDDSLTLQKLAKQINIPEKHLSFVINKVVGKHFYDYINFHRIEEAKILLKNKDLNIQEIMYDIGFNSKSSFNAAFKKNTATTPSTYRKTAV